MPERPEPSLDHVRQAMREREPAGGGEAPAPAAGVAYGRLDLEGEDRFQPLRRELGVSTFGMNLIRLRPRQRGRVHRHERQEEVFLVLEGTLTLELEDETRDLGRGELARVGPGLRRRLANRGDVPVAVLALGGAEPHHGRDARAFRDWDDTEGGSPQEIPLPPDA